MTKTNPSWPFWPCPPPVPAPVWRSRRHQPNRAISLTSGNSFFGRNFDRATPAIPLPTAGTRHSGSVNFRRGGCRSHRAPFDGLAITGLTLFNSGPCRWAAPAEQRRG